MVLLLQLTTNMVALRGNPQRYSAAQIWQGIYDYFCGPWLSTRPLTPHLLEPCQTHPLTPLLLGALILGHAVASLLVLTVLEQAVVKL